MRPSDLLLTAFLAMTCAGCAGLKITPDDSLATRLAKKLPRLALNVGTVGMSESLYFGPEEAKDQRERRTRELDQKMASFVGKPVDRLLLSWGQPNEVVPLESGKLLVYTKENSTTVDGTTTTSTTRTHGRDIHGNPVTHEDTETRHTAPRTIAWTTRRSFHVDHRGVVVDYHWQGL